MVNADGLGISRSILIPSPSGLREKSKRKPGFRSTLATSRRWATPFDSELQRGDAGDKYGSATGSDGSLAGSCAFRRGVGPNCAVHSDQVWAIVRREDTFPAKPRCHSD